MTEHLITSHGGTLRTYVIISTQTEQVAASYALNGEGGIMAALVDTDRPALDLVAHDGSRYGLDAPATARRAG